MSKPHEIPPKVEAPRWGISRLVDEMNGMSFDERWEHLLDNINVSIAIWCRKNGDILNRVVSRCIDEFEKRFDISLTGQEKETIAEELLLYFYREENDDDDVYYASTRVELVNAPLIKFCEMMAEKMTDMLDAGELNITVSARELYEIFDIFVPGNEDERVAYFSTERYSPHEHEYSPHECEEYYGATCIKKSY